MCWNAEVSLQSFGIGIAAVLLMWLKGSPPARIFCLLSISIMQFIEFIVWTFYNNSAINTAAAMAASALLAIQPLASLSLIPSAQATLRNTLISIYVTLQSILFTQTEHNLSKYHMRKGANGHLQWLWLERKPISFVVYAVYFTFLFLPLIIIKDWLLLSAGLVTLLFSFYSFWKTNTWGSMWCWIVILTASAAVLLG